MNKLFGWMAMATAVVAIGLGAGCSSEDDETTPGTNTTQQPALAGHWVSPSCEAYPGANGQTSYLRRDFTMTATTWSLKLTIYGDSGCTAPLFDAQIDGPYQVGAASSQVAGAYEAEFGASTNVWTLRADAMVDVLNGAGCGAGGWQVGVPQDVTATGCIGVAHKKAECPQEYDLVKVDGSSLYLGQRLTDLCTPERRPTALTTYPVQRQ